MESVFFNNVSEATVNRKKRKNQKTKKNNIPGLLQNKHAKIQKTSRKTKKQNYFTSSDPHHDMLGGGCQVRVVIKNMMGRMEKMRTFENQNQTSTASQKKAALQTLYLPRTTQQK